MLAISYSSYSNHHHHLQSVTVLPDVPRYQSQGEELGGKITLQEHNAKAQSQL